MNVVGRKKQKSSIVWLVLVLILLFVVGVRFFALGLSSGALDPGQELLVDDFGFTLLSAAMAKRESSMDEIDSLAQQDLVLKVRVWNHARRVDFAFDPRQVVVDDDAGHRFHPVWNGHAAGNSPSESCAILIAGESREFTITFVVPPEATGLRMRVLFGGRAGEILDWILFGDRWIAVDPA